MRAQLRISPAIQVAEKADEYISILPSSLNVRTMKFLVRDEMSLLELAGAAGLSMVLSRPKDLCEVETVEEEE